MQAFARHARRLDPDRLVLITSWQTEAGATEDITRFAIYEHPANWAKYEVCEVLDELFPSRYCQHEHDCCAHYYPQRAEYTKLSRNRILLEQKHVLNI